MDFVFPASTEVHIPNLDSLPWMVYEYEGPLDPLFQPEYPFLDAMKKSTYMRFMVEISDAG